MLRKIEAAAAGADAAVAAKLREQAAAAASAADEAIARLGLPSVTTLIGANAASAAAATSAGLGSAFALGVSARSAGGALGGLGGAGNLAANRLLLGRTALGTGRLRPATGALPAGGLGFGASVRGLGASRAGPNAPLGLSAIVAGSRKARAQQAAAAFNGVAAAAPAQPSQPHLPAGAAGQPSATGGALSVEGKAQQFLSSLFAPAPGSAQGQKQGQATLLELLLQPYTPQRSTGFPASVAETARELGARIPVGPNAEITPAHVVDLLSTAFVKARLQAIERVGSATLVNENDGYVVVEFPRGLEARVFELDKPLAEQKEAIERELATHGGSGADADRSVGASVVAAQRLVVAALDSVRSVVVRGREDAYLDQAATAADIKRRALVIRMKAAYEVIAEIGALGSAATGAASGLPAYMLPASSKPIALSAAEKQERAAAAQPIPDSAAAILELADAACAAGPRDLDELLGPFACTSFASAVPDAAPSEEDVAALRLPSDQGEGQEDLRWQALALFSALPADLDIVFAQERIDEAQEERVTLQTLAESTRVSLDRICSGGAVFTLVKRPRGATQALAAPSGAGPATAATETAPASPAGSVALPPADKATDDLPPVQLELFWKDARQARPILPQLPPATKGYTVTPTPSQLLQMSDAQLAALRSFTVERTNEGRIHWEADETLGGIDVRGLPLHRIIDISSEDGAAVYLPEDPNDPLPPVPYPPMGKGLNRPATVTLFGYFPDAGQSTADFVEQLKNPEKMVFVSYNMQESGAWTFKVEHFSRWGGKASRGEPMGHQETVRPVVGGTHSVLTGSRLK
jgi:hypothetical protein